MPTAESEPRPPDPSWPRYSHRPFPLYRFFPGRSPHPRHSPRGHSYGKTTAVPVLHHPEEWQRMGDYLYAIDLYNYAYWWECHEMLEGLWRAGQKTEQGNFFRALIQLAAANLKRFVGHGPAADNLTFRAIKRLEALPAFYMGLDVASLLSHLIEHPGEAAPLIHLHR